MVGKGAQFYKGNLSGDMEAPAGECDVHIGWGLTFLRSSKMTSEEYHTARIQELEAEVHKLKERLKSHSSLESGKKHAWFEGYQAAHEDISLAEQQSNPYT